jgi:hypothetical protein
MTGMVSLSPLNGSWLEAHLHGAFIVLIVVGFILLFWFIGQKLKTR